MFYLEDLIQISCNLSFQLAAQVEDSYGVLVFVFWSENRLTRLETFFQFSSNCVLSYKVFSISLSVVSEKSRLVCLINYSYFLFSA